MWTVNSIPSPQTTWVSYELIGNTEGGITETILLHPIFNSQNSIASMNRYPELWRGHGNLVYMYAPMGGHVNHEGGYNGT